MENKTSHARAQRRKEESEGVGRRGKGVVKRAVAFLHPMPYTLHPFFLCAFAPLRKNFVFQKFHIRLRLALALCLLIIFLFPSLPLSAGTHTISTATREGRLAVFDDVWETIRGRYYDPSLQGVDWLKQRERFRPLAAEARNSSEFYSILRRMIGLLRDAHTRVYAPDEKFDWQRPRHISIGISVREVEGLPVVVSVEPQSEAERAGLRAGDQLKSINGENAVVVFARRIDAQAGSSTVAAVRLRAMATLFEGAANSSVSVSWMSSDGKERTATLTRAWREREMSLHVRRVGNLGVLTFNAFTLAVAADFHRALKRDLRNARGLVIDLRGNGGGEAEAMAEIASAFLPAGKSLGRFTDRAGRVALEPHTRNAMLYVADAITRLQTPLIILTGESTSSAAEIFVAALKDAGRATVIGTSTCGCVLAIRRRHTLPDGGLLDISEMDYRTASSTRLEGTGILPDEKIEARIDDLRSGYDRALDNALKRLKS